MHGLLHPLGNVRIERSAYAGGQRSANVRIITVPQNVLTTGERFDSKAIVQLRCCDCNLQVCQRIQSEQYGHGVRDMGEDLLRVVLLAFKNSSTLKKKQAMLGVHNGVATSVAPQSLQSIIEGHLCWPRCSSQM